jgi:hypothetical protein
MKSELQDEGHFAWNPPIRTPNASQRRCLPRGIPFSEDGAGSQSKVLAESFGNGNLPLLPDLRGCSDTRELLVGWPWLTW